MKGMASTLSASQLANTPAPILVTLVGTITSESLAHSWKALLPISRRPTCEANCSVCRFTHLKNAYLFSTSTLAGMVISVSQSAAEKAPSPMILTVLLSGIVAPGMAVSRILLATSMRHPLSMRKAVLPPATVMLVSFEQRKNAPSSMVVRLLGSRMLSIAQPIKARVPRVFSEAGRLISCSFAHSEKALKPMAVMLSGSTMLSSPLHRENACGLISVQFAGRLISVSILQP